MAYIGNTQLNQNYVPAVDFFSGDGSTTAFTLSRPVASVAAIQAVISNVPQDPGTAFTVSGSTITFTSAPPSGTNNIYVYYTSPNTQVVQPGQGTVGATQIDGNYALWNKSGSTINYTAGNVGIGTASPSARLHVSTSSSTQAKFNRDGNNALLTIFQSATDSYISATNTGAALILATQDTERARINSSGNVGIGTSSPSGLGGKVLMIESASNYPEIILNRTGTGANKWGSVVGNDGSYLVRDYTAGANQVIVQIGGAFQFNSGYGSVATAYGCRAWVNFNGTGTVAIRASGNVTSITDNGTGDYTVNFTNAMPDANYVFGFGGYLSNGSSTNAIVVRGDSTATSSTFRAKITTVNLSQVDWDVLDFTFHR